MLNFVCTTAACLTWYLGTGYIVTRSDNAFLYRSYSENTDYFCKASGSVYQCIGSKVAKPGPAVQGIPFLP